MSASKKLHGLEQQLCFALYSSSHAMTRRYKPLLSPLGLTYPQYLALLVLFEADQIPVKHLVEKTGLDTGTLTPLLKRMETADLIVRKRSPEDERQVIITLTEKGRALRTPLIKVQQEIACATKLEMEKFEILLRDLNELTENLSEV